MDGGPETRRRAVLLATGGSLTAGLAGCLGGNGDDGSDENGSDDGEGDGEPAAEATFEVTLDTVENVTLETEAEIGYTVENTGDGEGTQELTLLAGGEPQASQEVTLEGGASTEGSFSYTPAEALDQLTLALESDDSSDSTSVTVEIPVVETFVARSTGGFITLGQETEQQARNEALTFPPTENVPEPLVIEGEVFADDSWESTSVEFPGLDITELLPQEFQAFDISVSIAAPDGYGGTLDREASTMTFEGALRLDLEIEGDTVDIAAELDATTGQSGELSGEYGLDEQPPTATVVENEYVIDDETGSGLIDDFLGLPAEDPIWMELRLEFDFE